MSFVNQPREETEPFGPEVAVIGEAFGAPRRREGLTGATPRPNRSSVGPLGRAEGVRPDSDAGEEVGLLMGDDVLCFQVSNGPGVDDTWRDVSGRNQVANPLRRVRLDFVVDRHGAKHARIIMSLVTILFSSLETAATIRSVVVFHRQLPADRTWCSTNQASVCAADSTDACADARSARTLSSRATRAATKRPAR